MKSLKKIAKIINGKVLIICKKVKEIINDDKGWGLIETILVGALIVIALLSLESPISNFFSGVWSDFSTWIDGKLTSLFS